MPPMAPSPVFKSPFTSSWVMSSPSSCFFSFLVRAALFTLGGALGAAGSASSVFAAAFSALASSFFRFCRMSSGTSQGANFFWAAISNRRARLCLQGNWRLGQEQR